MFFKYQPNNRAHQTKVYYPDLPLPIDGINNLFSAVLSGNLASVQEAMTMAQINANITDENKNNLLHTLIGSTYPVIPEEQKLQIIKFLVNNGASINGANNLMQTPLHLAAKYNYPTIIKYLTYHGANVNSQDIYKKTPLHYVINNSLVNCTAFRPDEAKDTLFNYEDINKVDFKEINNTLARTFQHNNFHQYFTDIANTVEAYIHDDEKVRKTLETSLDDVIANMYKYSQDPTTFNTSLFAVLTNTINGLKRTIVNNAGIDKALSTSVAFTLDTNKVEEYKKEMTDEYKKCHTQIINKLSKTIETVIKSTKKLNENYYNLIDSTNNLENNLEELIDIDSLIEDVFIHRADLDFGGIPDIDINNANYYIGEQVNKINNILYNPAALNRTSILNLINVEITLPADNIDKPLYHVKYLIEYAATFSNILNDIQSKHSNNLAHLAMLKLVIPSIVHVFNNIIIIIKIQQYIPLILKYITSINQISTILKGIKGEGAKIINILKNIRVIPTAPVGLELTIDVLVDEIEHKINAYNIPIREIQNIDKIKREDLNKALEEIYAINVKYYNDLIELMQCLNMSTSNNHLFGYVNLFDGQIVADNVFNKLINPTTKLQNTLPDFVKEYQEDITNDTLVYAIVRNYIIYLDDTEPPTNRLSLTDLALHVTMDAGTDTVNRYILGFAKHDEKGIEYFVNNVPDSRPRDGKGYLLHPFLNPRLCGTIRVLNGLQPACIRNISIIRNPIQIDKGQGFKLVNNNNLRNYITLIAYYIAEQFKDINDLEPNPIDNNTHPFRNLFNIHADVLDNLLEKMGQERIELTNKFRLLHNNNDIINNAVYNVFANSAIKLVYMYFEAVLNNSLVATTVNYLQTMQIPNITRPIGLGENNELLKTLKSMVNKDKVFDLKKFDYDLMSHLANPGIAYGKADLIKYEAPKFINKQITNDNNKLLSYIYDQNYNANITHSMCINENSLNTIKQLITSGANPNIQDNAGIIPLCYAISTLNLPIVNAIIALDNSKRYKDYKCSSKYLYKQYLFHDTKLITLNSLKSTLTFQKQISDNMVNRLVSKEAYKGLIPEYIENILPQVIIMFNHYLYDQMLTYSNVNKNRVNQLLTLISELKMNDIEAVNLELANAVRTRTLENKYRDMLIVSTFNIDNVQNIYKDDFKKYFKDKYKDKDYLISVANYNKRIPNYRSEHDKVNNNNLKQQLRNYMNGLTDDQRNHRVVHNNRLMANPIANKQLEKEAIEVMYQEYFDNIRLNTINLEVMKGIPTIYDELFNRVDNNSKIYKQLWDNYIRTPSVYTNLHLILVKIMMYFVGTSDNNNLRQIDGVIRPIQSIPDRHFNLIKGIYDDVIINSILPHLYSSPIYGSNNKLLNVTIDIIRHVIKTNIMPTLANLLYAQLIVHTKQEHNEDLIQRLYEILVNDALSLKITKHVLKIYEKDEVKENSFDFMFAELTNYIKILEFSGDPLDTKDVAKLYNIINETIKPYYTDLLVATIESMKLVLDNYYIFILNDYKYLQIFKTLS